MRIQYCSTASSNPVVIWWISAKNFKPMEHIALKNQIKTLKLNSTFADLESDYSRSEPWIDYFRLRYFFARCVVGYHYICIILPL